MTIWKVRDKASPSALDQSFHSHSTLITLAAHFIIRSLTLVPVIGAMLKSSCTPCPWPDHSLTLALGQLGRSRPKLRAGRDCRRSTRRHYGQLRSCPLLLVDSNGRAWMQKRLGQEWWLVP
jgi:hypothetical protein